MFKLRILAKWCKMCPGLAEFNDDGAAVSDVRAHVHDGVEPHGAEEVAVDGRECLASADGRGSTVQDLDTIGQDRRCERHVLRPLPQVMTGE